MKTIVTIETHYPDHDVKATRISVEAKECVDAMHRAMESNWSFRCWLFVMIAEAVASEEYSDDGSRLLREFLKHEKVNALIARNSYRQLYWLALDPDGFMDGNVDDMKKCLHENLGIPIDSLVYWDEN